MSRSNGVRVLVARIVEMYELLQALNVAVVKEPLLEVRPGGFGSRTLWRCQCHLARRKHFPLAIDRRRVLPPTHALVGARNPPPPSKNPQTPISLSAALTVWREPLGRPVG